MTVNARSGEWRGPFPRTHSENARYSTQPGDSPGPTGTGAPSPHQCANKKMSSSHHAPSPLETVDHTTVTSTSPARLDPISTGVRHVREDAVLPLPQPDQRPRPARQGRTSSLPCGRSTWTRLSSPANGDQPRPVSLLIQVKRLPPPPRARRDVGAHRPASLVRQPQRQPFGTFHPSTRQTIQVSR